MATKTIKLRGWLTVYNSRCDINGNCYFAFEYSDAETGLTLRRFLGGSARGNAGYLTGLLLRALASSKADPDPPPYESRHEKTVGEIRQSERELPIRDFNRLVRDWSYGDANAASVADFLPVLPGRFHARVKRWIKARKVEELARDARRAAENARWLENDRAMLAAKEEQLARETV